MNDRELNQWINFLTHMQVDLRYLAAETQGGRITDLSHQLHEALRDEVSSLRRIGEHVPAS